MNYWAFSSLVNLASSLFLGVLVIVRNPKGVKNITFALCCFVTALWSFPYFLWQISNDHDQALFLCRALMVGGIFVPICYFHHLIALVDKLKKYKIFISSIYLFGFISLLCDFTPYFVKDVSPKMSFAYWPDAGILFYPFVVIWFTLCVYEAYLTYIYLLKAEGVKRAQLKYVFIGTVIGWAGAFTNFPLWFNIPIPPVGNICVSIYLFFVAYTIVRYRLMDIKLAFTRASIFITVYTLVLGIPIWLGFRMFGLGNWLLPITLMALFATAGPFIFLNMQRRAEAALLAEQMRYQATLRQASSGMGRIRDLKRLLNLIVYILARVVRIEHALIYLYDPETQTYYLKASRRMFVGKPSPKDIGVDNPVIEYFTKHKDEPLIYEEILHKLTELDRSAPWGQLGKALAELNAALVFPIHIHDTLTAIVVLGKKVGRRVYAEDDLTVFSILSSQAALAIENAQSYEDMRKTHEQLLRAEKMATIGTMADGVAHQINNRFHCLGLISSDAMDTIDMKRKKGESLTDPALIIELENALKHVQDNVYQGREIVRGLLQYTRHGEEGLVALKFTEVLESAINMVKFKVHLSDIEMTRDIPDDLPELKGNFVQIQEVLFNLIDNAYDAMMSRKFEMGEEGYQPVLKVSARGEGRSVIFTFEDNGTGVKDENKHKLFVPFFTTKATSKKGTGLGLYVIKKIIEENHSGETIFDSQYGVGTKIVIKLPAFVKSEVPEGAEDPPAEK
jgi:signal transduction histidine kinase